MPAWTSLGEVVTATLAMAARELPDGPRVLLGYSLGGAVCVDLLLREPELAMGLRGLVLTNPALDAAGVARWRVLVARLLSQLMPRRCSLRLGAGFLAMAATLRQRAPDLPLPLLVLQSGDDLDRAQALADLRAWLDAHR